MLDELYYKIEKDIQALNFSCIWPGFSPLKFALYDDEKCFFDGSYIEKTDEFCANTSIVFNGEQIAIWKVEAETQTAVLTSKIVHEMFHGYQALQNWDCWPDEHEALQKYEYRTENLSLKLRENKLLFDLLERFDISVFSELLRLRKMRSVRFPYEFTYESKAEEIEGTANYVEWQVLKQLDPSGEAALVENMRRLLMEPEGLFPIRIPCYYSGALMIHAMLEAGIYSFDAGNRPFILHVLNDIPLEETLFEGREDLRRCVSAAIASFTEKTREIVQCALDKNDVVLNGPAELISVNIYDARYYNGFLTSRYFLMYRRNGETETIYGDFVIQMEDTKTISKVYRWYN